MPVLGIDTSCYTTSIALVDGSMAIVERRKLLIVPEGGRGLQQSSALFQHIQNLPVLLESIGPAGQGIRAVAASTRPRPVDGSYMPVFTAGQSAGRLLASAIGVPFFETSHQEGHIMAGCFSADWIPDKPFLAFHISGGTTELLVATPAEAGFQLTLIGETTDLHAGQVIDRIGVAMGLPFPAGPALENLARQYERNQGSIRLKPHLSGSNCSLSGVESAAQRHIAAGADHRAVAYEVQRCLAEVFSSMARNASESTGITELLVIGGVASNQYIRQQLETGLGQMGITVRFAVNPLSSDNAVGVAAIGQQFLR